MTSSFPLWKYGVNAVSSFIFIMTIWDVANLCQSFCISPENPELYMSTGRLSLSLQQGDMTAFKQHAFEFTPSAFDSDWFLPACTEVSALLDQDSLEQDGPFFI